MADNQVTKDTAAVIEAAETSRTTSYPLTQQNARNTIEEIAAKDPEAIKAALEKLAFNQSIAKADIDQIRRATTQDDSTSRFANAPEMTAEAERSSHNNRQTAKDADRIIVDAEASRTATTPAAQEEARGDIRALAAQNPEALKAALDTLAAAESKAKYDSDHIRIAIGKYDAISQTGQQKESVEQVARNLADAGVNPASELPGGEKPAALARVVPKEAALNVSKKT